MSAPDDPQDRPAPDPTPEVCAGANEEQLQALVEDYLGRLRDGEEPDTYELMLLHLPVAQEVEQRLETAALLHRLARARPADGEGNGAPSPGSPVTSPAGEGTPPVGRYKPQGVLGAGTSGVVYRAFDPVLCRHVALKVLRPGRPANAAAVQVFERDARIAARLRHPNIVPVHETGEDGGQRYFVMELIDGETLDARLKQGPLSPRAAAELVGKLASALAYAHSAGVVHRDVKPANVLLGQGAGGAEEPYLTDFGLARHAGVEGSIAQRGDLLGTLTYMSPEQAQGRADEADARSDVYGLGAVLFHALAGRVPFEAGTPGELLAKVVGAPPPKPREINAAVPPDLQTICLKALAKEPARRFATAEDFAEELGRWLRQEPLKTRPPRLGEVLWLWASRNRPTAWAIGVSAVALLLVSTALGAWVRVAREEAESARVGALIAEANKITESQTRAEVEARALLALASRRLQVPTRGRRSEAQAILRKLTKPRGEIAKAALREELDFLARSCFAATLGAPDVTFAEGDELSLPRNPQPWPTAIHPDGDLMAVGTPRRPLVWSRGQAPKFPDGPNTDGIPTHLAYSPTGKYLAFAPAEGGLLLYDREGTSSREVVGATDGAVLAAGFDPEERAVRACLADGRVRTYSLPTLGETGPSPWTNRCRAR
ncbi:MAG TPA: serine/threonine-protein kinase [Gemmataceae bacterium]|nr:serine/threonine-protein kinase [Gemmataceae bacterium]